jgi:hypothetical protein
MTQHLPTTRIIGPFFQVADGSLPPATYLATAYRPLPGRYTGRTVKFTFSVTDLVDALSVTLISSR